MQIIFKPAGYAVIDGELSFTDIYNLAFDAAKPEDAGLLYLARIAKKLVDDARRDPDITITRRAKTPDQADFFSLPAELPYVLAQSLSTSIG